MKLVRLVLSCCVVSMGCVALSGCGEQKSQATAPDVIAPQLPGETTFSVEDNTAVK